MAVTYDSAQAIADVPGATYEALRARFVALATVVDVLSAERQALANEIRAREKEAELQLRIGSLTEEQKAIYRNIINSPTFAGP